MRSVKISTQIALLSILSLFAFLVIGAVYYYSSSNLASYRMAGVKATQALENASEANSNFLNARRKEKDFFLRKDEKYVGQHAKVITSAIANMRDLATYHKDQETQQAIKTIVGKLDVYETQFQTLAQEWRSIGLSEKLGLMGKLRRSVHEVESQLKAYNDDALTVKMLMMRRHEKDFLMRLADKYIGRIDQRHAEFLGILPTSKVPVASRDSIKTLLASYVTDFKQVAELRLKIKQDTKLLSQYFAEAEGPLAFVTKRTQDDYHAAVQQAEATAQQAELTMLLTIALTLVVTIGLGVRIAKGIRQPIHAMQQAMVQLSAGDKETPIPATDYTNELGDMAKAVEVFKSSMLAAERLAHEQAAEQKAQIKRAEHLNMLTIDFDRHIQKVLGVVHASVRKMEEMSVQMQAEADHVSKQSSVVASAATEAAANVQTVSAASEELSASITEIATQVGQSTQVTIDAVKQAGETNIVVNELAESTNRIGEVLKFITDIAEQTNLLALNATIEAARAGAAGKGFAVVASEVKNLANQTAKATDEISTQINSVQSSVKQTIAAIRNITGIVQSVHEFSSTIASAIEEQTAATQEIARNVEEAAQGTDTVTRNIAQVSDAAKTSESAAGEVLDASRQLSVQSTELESYVTRFLKDVRAA